MGDWGVGAGAPLPSVGEPGPPPPVCCCWWWWCDDDDDVIDMRLRGGLARPPSGVLAADAAVLSLSPARPLLGRWMGCRPLGVFPPPPMGLPEPDRIADRSAMICIWLLCPPPPPSCEPPADEAEGEVEGWC